MKTNLGDDWGVKINTLIEQIFGAAESVKEQVYSELEKSLHFNTEGLDYYPAYNYPPMNVSIRTDKTLVFEFALAGFEKESIHLRFQGDFMFVSADWTRSEPSNVVTWLKKRLKAKSIIEQKYFVPAKRFDQSKTTAEFKNGLLTITIPSSEKEDLSQEIIIPIKT